MRRKSSVLVGEVSHSHLCPALRIDVHSPYVAAHPIPAFRLLQLFHRGPPGCLYDCSEERGSHGRRGAQEASRACSRLAQRCSEAPQTGGTHAACADALTAAGVSHDATIASIQNHFSSSQNGVS